MISRRPSVPPRALMKMKRSVTWMGWLGEHHSLSLQTNCDENRQERQIRSTAGEQRRAGRNQNNHTSMTGSQHQYAQLLTPCWA
eukprot:1138063-Pelagomonas_calceolata.AAC.9